MACWGEHGVTGIPVVCVLQIDERVTCRLLARRDEVLHRRASGLTFLKYSFRGSSLSRYGGCCIPEKLSCAYRWEDGLPVQSWLDRPNRWQTQAAERVTLELSPGNTVAMQQQASSSCWATVHIACAPARSLSSNSQSCGMQPRALTAARLGVGACIWDGALVLAAYLAAQPPGTFAGTPSATMHQDC